jgi:hypothetical protein
LVSSLKVAVDKLGKLHEDLVCTEVRCIEAISDYETLEERNGEVNRLLKEKAAEVSETTRLLSASTKRAQKARTELQDLSKKMEENPGLDEVVAAVKEYTVDQLEADIGNGRRR